MSKNLVREPFKATKLLKNRGFTLLLILLFVLMLLVGSQVFGAVEENFNAYDDGNVVGQGNWGICPLLEGWVVSGIETYEGAKAIACVNEYCGDHMNGVNPAWNETWRVWLYFVGDECSEGFDLYLGKQQGEICSDMNILFWLGDYKENDTCKVAPTGENLVFNKWVSTDVEWDISDQIGESKYRVRYNESAWTSWLSLPSYAISPSWISGVILYADTRDVDVKPILLDYFSEPPPIPECDYENCDLCLSEETCFFAGCYWATSTCETKVGACGLGYNLRFCETQGECESLGGYWLADFCWETEPPAITEWGTYYSEHSKFATPTSMIASLVNLTAPILETSGGWLVALGDIFDVAKAGEKGEQFGEAIPTARGYLATINDFFGGFPLSEAFVFFLVITLGVGVFRIIRNIISLIKLF